MKSNMVYNIPDIRSFRELIDNSVNEYAQLPAFVWREPDDSMGQTTYAEFYGDIICFAAWLLSKGLENKKIAIIGKNCYEWALSYLTVGCGVGIIVPIDRDSHPYEIAAMLGDSQAAAVIYSAEKGKDIGDFGGLKICMDDIKDCVEQGRKLRENGERGYENHRVDPDGFGILLYTSATTGTAKGVMLSQRNICSDIVAVCRQLSVTSDDRALSVLPLHHTYETAAGFLTIMMRGGSIAYATSLKKFAGELAFFSPTVLAAVPLLLQNILDRIYKKVGLVRGGKTVFGMIKAAAGVAGALHIDVKRKLFASVHASLGGRLRMVVCGAAPLPPALQREYAALGITVYNGYGMTEASPVCLMQNDMTGIEKPGIGRPLVGMKARLLDLDANGIGELEVTGPNIMLGYYNNKEQTDKVLRDGWLRTGDLARFDEKTGFYEIVGRKKNVIVTKGGKNIYPEELEYLLKKHPIIDDVMLCGYEDEDGNVTLAAVVYPDIYAVDSAMEGPIIERDSEEYMKVAEKLTEQAIRDVNRGLSNAKIIRRYYIRREDFVKTTTHKIKRADPSNRPAWEELCELHSAISE